MATVKFWLNAFIPQTVTGYTKVLSKGVHTGKSAIPLPGIARGWPGNWNKDWDCGYLTDQRSFDNAFGASSRMTSWAEVDATAFALIKTDHSSSGTTEVNLATGVQNGFAVADMTRCSFTARPTSSRSAPGGIGAHLGVAKGGTMPLPPTTPSAIVLDLSAKAGDPLVGAAADIDYVGTLTISVGSAPGSIMVAFDGKIDEFPAYDCYASYKGMTKTLFTSPPPAGKTVADLLWYANRPVSGSVLFA